MSRHRISGFTLIELMVVIVIIGVLASLAIPRFTEASAKAKIAEAPRVLASFESAFLAAVAEVGYTEAVKDSFELIFDVPKDSKWFDYERKASSATAKPSAGKIGAFPADGVLASTYVDANDCFSHTATPAATAEAAAKKMVPNFINGGCAVAADSTKQ